MFRRFASSEKGFTLIELMSTLVILGIALGSISQVFLTGQRLINKQSSQLDLRMTSRMIMTRMEKDVQSAVSVDVTGDGGNHQYVKLFNAGGKKYKEYYYDKTQGKLTLNEYSTPGSETPSKVTVLASNVSVADFAGMANVNTTSISAPKIPVSLSLSAQNENLDVQTTMSPRWNTGPGAPYIFSVSPSSLSSGSNTYSNIVIKGANTHFNANSVVTLQDSGQVFASTNVSGTTPHVVAADGLTLTVTLYTVGPDGGATTDPLPFGYYDLYVDSPQPDGTTERVYKYSLITCKWNNSDWMPTNGNFNSGGWDDTNFPYVSKAINGNGNSNDKADYFVPLRTPSNFNVKVAIKVKDMGTTTQDAPAGEIAMWASSDASAKSNSYIGFGINNNFVFYRKVVDNNVIWSYKIQKAADNTTSLVQANSATLQAIASGGYLQLYVGDKLVNSLFPSGTPFSFTNPVPSGTLGVTADHAAVQFGIIRL